MPKAVPFKVVLKHKTVIVGFVVLRLQIEPDESPRVMDVNCVNGGHGYALILQRAVGSALAGVAARDAIATAVAAIARPKILMRFTGGSPFHGHRGADESVSPSVFPPGAVPPQ
jgi:hypothetical protein